MFKFVTRTALGLCAAAAVSLGAWAQDLTIGLGANVTSIDPHFHNLSPNNNIAVHIFGRLIEQDEKQRLKPGLATEWKAIDNDTWEFKLRQGVKFHDGSDFTAEDVVATLKRVPWVPNSPSSFAIYTRAITETIVVDPYTIRFKTKAPYPLLPIDLSTIHIISKKAEQAPTGDFNNGKAAIGTGPFKFVEYVPGDRIVLARNDAYWGDKPHWAKVTLKLITNNSARVAALLAGDVQLIEAGADLRRRQAQDQRQRGAGARGVEPADLPACRQLPRPVARIVTDKAGGRAANNPLKDKRVRQAISQGDQPPRHRRPHHGRRSDPRRRRSWPKASSAPARSSRPTRSTPRVRRKLLAEAGYPNGFGLTLHGPNDRYPNDEKIIQAIGPMLTRVGIDTKVVSLPWATFASQGSAPTYAWSLMLVGWGSGTGEASLAAALAAGDGGAGPRRLEPRPLFQRRRWTRTLDQALATVDDEKREALLQQASEIAIGDYGLIPLHYQVNLWAMRKGLSYVPRTDEYTLAQFVKPN